MNIGIGKSFVGAMIVSLALIATCVLVDQGHANTLGTFHTENLLVDTHAQVNGTITVNLNAGVYNIDCQGQPGST